MKSKPVHNQVRINAGVWRSRLLKFSDADGLRPTPERVRQTVFNWLGQDMTDKTCLDLFAGTGAFGFEALSRNAREVVMVEWARSAYQSLLQNKALLHAEHAVIHHQDALQFLQQTQQQFDVIFCDPPYQKAWIAQVLPHLPTCLKPNGVIYVEAEFSIASTAEWQVFKQSKAGNVYYHLLKYSPSA